jgi:hypothetical protein
VEDATTSRYSKFFWATRPMLLNIYSLTYFFNIKGCKACLYSQSPTFAGTNRVSQVNIVNWFKKYWKDIENATHVFMEKNVCTCVCMFASVYVCVCVWVSVCLSVWLSVCLTLKENRITLNGINGSRWNFQEQCNLVQVIFWAKVAKKISKISMQTFPDHQNSNLKRHEARKSNLYQTF